MKFSVFCGNPMSITRLIVNPQCRALNRLNQVPSLTHYIFSIHINIIIASSLFYTDFPTNLYGFFVSVMLTGSRDRVVGIATGCGLDSRGVGFRVPVRSRNFTFSTSCRPALTQSLIQCVPGALSQGVKWPRREADHSSPTSAEVKKMWIYTSTPPYAFMA
jgi:hypothetical protein